MERNQHEKPLSACPETRFTRGVFFSKPIRENYVYKFEYSKEVGFIPLIPEDTGLMVTQLVQLLMHPTAQAPNLLLGIYLPVPFGRYQSNVLGYLDCPSQVGVRG